MNGWTPKFAGVEKITIADHAWLAANTPGDDQITHRQRSLGKAGIMGIFMDCSRAFDTTDREQSRTGESTQTNTINT